jgi:hypothetical protein
VGADREPGVAVDELEDHAFASAGQDVFGCVQLPARVRRRINKPTILGSRFLLRLEPSNARVAEDPRQGRDRRDWFHPQGAHLLVDTDRPVIQTRLPQRRANPDRPRLRLIRDPVPNVDGRRVRGSKAAA